MKTTERVHFRLIAMPCCGHMFCSVNSRWPSYCPQCGAMVYPRVQEGVRISDPDAKLVYDLSKRP